jgi:hypothetical protein
LPVNIVHIISHTVPYPDNYGGITDIFNKIRTLHQLGVKVKLHCYDYGRGRQPELEQYCASVNYYDRFKYKFRWMMPYIVSSRINKELVANLLQDDYPIIMEGVHCTFLVHDKRFNDRKMLVRTFNVEHLYYKGLRASTRNPFRWLYYAVESYLLKKYECKISKLGVPMLTIGKEDAEIFNNLSPEAKASYMPVFIPHSKVSSPTGNGFFCLYHGNLSVDENEKAVIWLLENVFSKTKLPIVIAGYKPSKYLEDLIHKNMNACLAKSPTDDEMKDLVTKAQVNILPSVNATGVKLKVLNSLLTGRHCIANDHAVKGFENKNLVMVANDSEGMITLLEKYFNEPFTESHKVERSRLLQDQFNNFKNAQALLSNFS